MLVTKKRKETNQGRDRGHKGRVDGTMDYYGEVGGTREGSGDQGLGDTRGYRHVCDFDISESLQM